MNLQEISDVLTDINVYNCSVNMFKILSNEFTDSDFHALAFEIEKLFKIRFDKNSLYNSFCANIMSKDPSNVFKNKLIDLMIENNEYLYLKHFLMKCSIPDKDISERNIQIPEKYKQLFPEQHSLNNVYNSELMELLENGFPPGSPGFSVKFDMMVPTEPVEWYIYECAPEPEDRSIIVSAALFGSINIFNQIFTDEMKENTQLKINATKGGCPEIIERTGKDHITALEYRRSDEIFPASLAAKFLNYKHVFTSNDFLSKADGKSALHFSSIHGRLDVIKFLLDKIDIDARDDDGNTALYYAIVNKLNDIVYTLLRNKADPNIQCNNHVTVLMITEDPQIVDFLLHCKADPNIVDVNGNNSMHYAVEQNSHQKVASLLKIYDNKVKNINGKTPKDLALEKENFTIYGILSSYDP